MIPDSQRPIRRRFPITSSKNSSILFNNPSSSFHYLQYQATRKPVRNLQYSGYEKTKILPHHLPKPSSRLQILGMYHVTIVPFPHHRHRCYVIQKVSKTRLKIHLIISRLFKKIAYTKVSLHVLVNESWHLNGWYLTSQKPQHDEENAKGGRMEPHPWWSNCRLVEGKKGRFANTISLLLLKHSSTAEGEVTTSTLHTPNRSNITGPSLLQRVS